jgi:serine/threonine protein kinase
MSLTPGSRVGAYEIFAAIGAGGMGEVYRARDRKLERDVAIKILPEALAGDPERIARFEREAKTLAALNHPNIAHIHGVEESDGIRALVMELVEGPTLADRLLKGPLPIQEATGIATQIADGLDAAHERGIVHRDLKPANIKITSDGRVKLLDFGIAKLVVGDVAGDDLTHAPTVTVERTRDGVLLGTAAYMSPEQARGQVVDKRTDIWAFGCVLYEMLTGRSTFARHTVTDTLAAIIEREPDWAALPPSTPSGILDLLHRFLEKNPKRRLRDVGDARIEIETSIAGGGRQALRIRRWLVPATVGIVALAWFLWSQHERRPASAQDPVRNATFSQITDQSGIELFPSLSPDGRALVYASRASGNWDIYFQRVGGKNPVNLTRNSEADDTQPAFSSDGDRIAFRSERDGGGIFVMGATGESVRRLTTFGYNPTWSPDGKEIAFASEGITFGPDARAPTSQLWTVNVATGDRKLVLMEDAIGPSWSPHGDRIAYAAFKEGRRSIWAIPARDARRVEPRGPVVVELRVETAYERGRARTETVIEAPGQSVPRASIHILANVDRRLHGNRPLAQIHRPGRWLDVIDAASIPIVASADQHARTIVRPKAPCDGTSKLIEPPTTDNVRVASHR